jgi:hypothetical protein
MHSFSIFIMTRGNPNLGVNCLQHRHGVWHGIHEPVDGQLCHNLSVGHLRDPPDEGGRLAMVTPLVQEEDPLQREAGGHVRDGQRGEALV